MSRRSTPAAGRPARERRHRRAPSRGRRPRRGRSGRTGCVRCSAAPRRFPPCRCGACSGGVWPAGSPSLLRTSTSYSISCADVSGRRRHRRDFTTRLAEPTPGGHQHDESDDEERQQVRHRGDGADGVADQQRDERQGLPGISTHLLYRIETGASSAAPKRSAAGGQRSSPAMTAAAAPGSTTSSTDRSIASAAMRVILAPAAAPAGLDGAAQNPGAAVVGQSVERQHARAPQCSTYVP